MAYPSFKICNAFLKYCVSIISQTTQGGDVIQDDPNLNVHHYFIVCKLMDFMTIGLDIFYYQTFEIIMLFDNKH